MSPSHKAMWVSPVPRHPRAHTVMTIYGVRKELEQKGHSRDERRWGKAFWKHLGLGVDRGLDELITGLGAEMTKHRVEMWLVEAIAQLPSRQES